MEELWRLVSRRLAGELVLLALLVVTLLLASLLVAVVKRMPFRAAVSEILASETLLARVLYGTLGLLLLAFLVLALVNNLSRRG